MTSTLKRLTVENVKQTTMLIGLAVFQLSTMGCGAEADRPDLGRVSGIVSLNGQPLPFANVSFRASDGGRVSQAQSNADGYYELIYLDNPYKVLGAKIGENIVYVSTSSASEDDDKPSPELVPECYRKRDSVKRVEVKKGVNEINIELTSQCQ